ncbi:MAG: H/ACA ribonucleoprotein complex subunit 3 [archaeon GW2011_AR9]|nr:MAG: H/ACA ribonucleoprotein complex subunit 3 [archaeon GW2011_AR9]MBS3120605.1 ribosome biogenesis protein [Candidatus Woesearchaeota archaeon]HIG93019.1 ribosome biogenesis protein [Candidatus Woesearchaeota archaeon]HIH12485.1 ribosome biogenesis protein [Candidatus Woesearchaeota archaeon]
MAEHIHQCPACKKYTLKTACAECKRATLIPRPISFSIEDKYGQYRRESKKKEWKEKGLY